MNIEKYLVGKRFRYIEICTNGTFSYYSHILGKEIRGSIDNPDEGRCFISLSGPQNRHIFKDAGISEENRFLFCKDIIGYMPENGDCPEVKTIKDVVTILGELDNRLTTLHGPNKHLREEEPVIASPSHPVIPELGQTISYKGKLYEAIKEPKPDSCEGCPLNGIRHPGIDCKTSKHLILREISASKDPKEVLDVDIEEVSKHPEDYQFRPISFASKRKHYKLSFKI